MAELIQQYKDPVVAEDGTPYMVRAYGERQGGTWIAWLEFHPATDTLPVRRTDRETSQPGRDALSYWASGLEPFYFLAALMRARDFREVDRSTAP